MRDLGVAALLNRSKAPFWRGVSAARGLPRQPPAFSRYLVHALRLLARAPYRSRLLALPFWQGASTARGASHQLQSLSHRLAYLLRPRVAIAGLGPMLWLSAHGMRLRALASRSAGHFGWFMSRLIDEKALANAPWLLKPQLNPAAAGSEPRGAAVPAYPPASHWARPSPHIRAESSRVRSALPRRARSRRPLYKANSSLGGGALLGRTKRQPWMLAFLGRACG